MDTFIVVAAILTCFWTQVFAKHKENDTCFGPYRITSIEKLELLRKCRVIEGSLTIKFDLKNSTTHDFSNYSFPDFREITEYLRISRVSNLSSVGILFPNLTVIRGIHLSNKDYALEIREMPDLEEVGLRNLLLIQNGGVKIDDTPELCYGQTVDWESLFELNSKSLEVSVEYPDKCKAIGLAEEYCSHWSPEKYCSHCDNTYKYCWSNDTQACQSKYPDRQGLLEYEVSMKCPPEQYRTAEGCLSKEDCFKLRFTHMDGEIQNSNLSGKLLDDSCVPECDTALYNEINNICESKGKYVCPDRDIYDVTDATEFNGCLYVPNSLKIGIKVPQNKTLETLDLLTRYLGSIEVIHSQLVIQNTSGLRNLNFLRNLNLVLGWQPDVSLGNSSLIITNNADLQDLWNWDERADRSSFHFTPQGIADIRDNSKLCRGKVDTFLEMTDFTLSRKDLVDLCHETGLEIENVKSGSCNVTFAITSRKNEFTKFPPNFGVCYLKKGSTNHICRQIKTSWTSSKLVAFSNDSQMVESTAYPNPHVTKLVVKELDPYTNYAMYARTEDNKSKPLEISQIFYFKTRPGKPSKPFNVTLKESSLSNAVLTWRPPRHRNGNLKYYMVEGSTSGNLSPSACSHMNSADMNIFQKTQCSCNVALIGNSFEDVIYTRFQFCTLHNTSSEIQKNIFNHKLLHCAEYKICVSACREAGSEDEDCPCGEYECSSTRTQPLPDADKIIETSIEVSVKEKKAYLKWTPPTSPNGNITRYVIEYRRIGEIESSRTKNITAAEFEGSNNSTQLDISTSGNYTFSINVSSACAAEPTKTTVNLDVRFYPTVEDMLIWVAILMSIALIGYLIYRYYATRTIYKNEIPRRDVTVEDRIGAGAFGVVHKGIWLHDGIHEECAVKICNKTKSCDIKAFLNEGATMTELSESPFIVNVLGIVSRGSPPMVVMEFMGQLDLQNFLQDSYNTPDDARLFKMAAQIADGMAYLEANKYVHRDLAARNCMLKEDLTVKVGDFGLTRNIGERGYYRTEDVKPQPIRWMAPESVKKLAFTTSSDVWSYGVVLWEIATRAREEPYHEIEPEGLREHIAEGGKLSIPENFLEPLKNIMRACFNYYPQDRPSFFNILDILDQAEVLDEDFKDAAYSQSPEGKKYWADKKEMIAATNSVQFTDGAPLLPSYTYRFSKASGQS